MEFVGGEIRTWHGIKFSSALNQESIDEVAQRSSLDTAAT